MPELYSISRLSEELSLDRRTISKRLAALVPAKENKTSKLYYLADVVKELIAQAVEEVKPTTESEEIQEEDGDAYGREKVRLTRAQADKMELELAISRREVIPVNEIESIWGNIAGAVKAKMGAIPSRASHQVLGLEQAIEIETVLKKLVDQALTELADSDPDEYGDDTSNTVINQEDA